MSFPGDVAIHWGTQISRNKYPNLYRRASGIGFNGALGTPTVTAPVSCFGGTGLYPFPTAPTQMQLRSTSAADSAAGTGMRTLSLAQIDGSYNELSAAANTFTLNGTTPVPVPTALLGNNGMRGVTAGSSGTNVGTIFLEALGGGTVYGVILPGCGVAYHAPHVVPAGFTLIVPQLFINVGSAGGGSAQFAQMRTWFQFFNASGSCGFMPLPIGNVNGVPYPHMADPPITIPEKSLFDLRITDASGSNPTCTAAWNGFYEKI